MSKCKGFRRRMGRSTILDDLARGIVGVTYHHLHSIVNTLLDPNYLDTKGLNSCLGVLKKKLCATVYLDLTTERNIFTT